MSIDSLTEKYKFNESDIDLSDDSSVELPTESDIGDPSKYLKNTTTEAITLPVVPATEELFEDTETDKRKFFEALDQGSVDYKQLLDNLSDSDSEDVNTSELLRDVLGSNKDDEYSMSFESVTDLKEVKYDSKYENETDIMTGMSLVSETVEHQVTDVPSNRDIHEETTVHGEKNSENVLVQDSGVLLPTAVTSMSEDVQPVELNAQESEQNNDTEPSPPQEAESEVVSTEKLESMKKDVMEHVSNLLEHSAESNPIEVGNTLPFIGKSTETTPYLTFADLMKMNQDKHDKKEPSATKEADKVRFPDRKRQPSPVRKASQQQSVSPIRKKNPNSNSGNTPTQISANDKTKPKSTPNKKKELLQRASNKFSSKESPASPKKDRPITRIPNPPRPASVSPMPEQPLPDANVKLLEDQLAEYQREISRVMDDMKILEAQNESNATEIMSLENLLRTREQDIKTLQQQIEFLETALTNEKTSKVKPSGPLLTLEESEQIKKEIADQEYLIRGVTSINLVPNRK
jgi:hypothetical protein